MIKKSLFEDDLIAGMQYELRSQNKKEGIENLVKAADYLNSAMEILEEAGFTAKADQILKILAKIAQCDIANCDESGPEHKEHIYMTDDTNFAEDLLNAEVNTDPIELSEDEEKTFEDTD